MKLALSFLVLVVFSESCVGADSAATVSPLPFDEFKSVAGKRDVSIDAVTKESILKWAEGQEPTPPHLATLVKTLRGDQKSVPLEVLMPILEPQNGQPISARMAKHSDPVVRFVAGICLCASGNTDAAQSVHSLIHDESLPLIDKRIIRTWCDGIGVRAASDDVEKIRTHLANMVKRTPKFKNGDVAPDFKFKTAMGRDISSRELRGKVIVLHFWATWCAPCMGRLPSHIKDLSQHKRDAVEIVFVSLDEDQKAFDSAVEKHKIPFIVTRDGSGWGGDLARIFGINSLPFEIVIDRNGRIFSNSLEDVAAAVASTNADDTDQTKR